MATLPQIRSRIHYVALAAEATRHQRAKEHYTAMLAETAEEAPVGASTTGSH